MAEHRWGKELDTVILTVTWDLLAEVGYAKLTMSAIAKAAHTNKNAIYRRWPNKATLVLSTIQQQAPAIVVTAPNTGDLKTDLITLFSRFTPLLTTVDATIWQQLLPEALLTMPNEAGVSGLLVAINGDNLITTAVTTIIDHAKARHDALRPTITDDQRQLPALLLINQIMLTGSLPSDKIDELVTHMLLPLYLQTTKG